MLKKLVFLGMGGTIAGSSDSSTDNVGYKAGQVCVTDLLEVIAGLQSVLGDHQLVSEQVAQLDSKDWVTVTGRRSPCE